MIKNEKNLDWIQLLRGVAALLVVLTHARYALLGTDSFPLAQQIFLPGAMGVDLFFIISGFIMCYSTATSDGSLS
ncbi:acyltransferase family protein [Pseudolysobacter antarcticus]|uniref:acyltransferase family protein n=1 Tax=Pseudolysobacter antarcticus TaxID=2511995 RepID=UPI001A9350F8|nr:acyltransferase family protein [Pseudolysobacter antarcticus]